MVKEKKAKKEKKLKKDLNRFPISDHPIAIGAAWFVVHTYSGHEYKVVQALKQRVETMGLEDKIYEAVIPLRAKFIIRRGQKAETKEKVFPGYVMVRMLLDDNSWIVVKTTPGVTGFVGTGNQPTPIPDLEVEKIVEKVEKDKPKYTASFSVGEAVKITDGPFADSLGTVVEVDDKRGKLKVTVSIFDRETPVELDFLQVAKI